MRRRMMETEREQSGARYPPTGAHDMYKTGEYMIWTDGNTYKCIQDTNFSPEEYAQAWENA